MPNEWVHVPLRKVGVYDQERRAVHPDQLDGLGRPFGFPVDPKAVQPKKASQEGPRLLVACHNDRG